MKNNKGVALILIILIIVGALALGGGTYYFLVKKTQKPVSCTQEAKVCLDGSTVGRTGPNCEFATCPTVKTGEIADWKTYRNNEVGIEFQYPSEWGELTIIGESSKESPSEIEGAKVSICGPDGLCVSAFTQDYWFYGMQDGAELEYLGRISDKPRLNCSYYELKPCESFAIQGEKAVSVYLPHMGYNSLATYKAVFVENSDQKFSGIVISQFIKGLTKEFSTVEEMIKSKKDYILTAQEALTKSTLSAEVQEDLQRFDRIVSTFKLIR